jgi:hypothetical protein
MKFTDKNAIRMLEKVRCYDLQESIDNYPEDEGDGRSDMQILADEAGYIYSCYSEDGHVFCDDLAEAKRKLRETKNGKVIPVDKRTLKPKYGYNPTDIQIARDTIQEYKRLERLVIRLDKMGYHSRWL